METKGKNLVYPQRQLNCWEAILFGMMFLSSIDLVKCLINARTERERIKHGTKEEETKKRGIF